jgi:hypothetical protein
MADILISFSDKTTNELIDAGTPIRLVRTTDQTQFRAKNCFVPNQVLVIDSTLTNDKEFIEWAVVNTRKDLIVLIHPSHNITLNLKDLKKSSPHDIQVLEKAVEPKDNLFSVLNQVMCSSNRSRVHSLLKDSTDLFPLLLKWLLGSVTLFSEENQRVIEEIDEKYMRRNTDAIVRNLAYGITPEKQSIRFQWAFPKAEDKKRAGKNGKKTAARKS